MLHPSLLSRLLVLVLVASCGPCGSSKDRTLPAQPVDCGEDLGCFIARARSCAPASVIAREALDDSGATVRTVTRHEVVGWVRGRCHLRRTRLEPTPLAPWPPEVDLKGWPVELSGVDAVSPPLLQCLYPAERAAEVMERLSRGASTPEDLEPCYPGDGRCVRVPVLYPGCVLGECLLGRWTYTCETRDGRNLYACEGTRRSDAERGRCASWCGPDGHEQMECIDPEKWKRHQRRP